MLRAGSSSYPSRGERAPPCHHCIPRCEGCGCRLQGGSLESGFCVQCLPRIVAALALEEELRERGIYLWDLEE